MTTRLTFTGGKYHTYHLDGEKVPSVTQLLAQLDKSRTLVPWATRVTARYAVDHWDSLAAMEPEERFAMVKGEPNRIRDRAAASGTQIHKWAEALLHGEPVDIPKQHTAAVEGFARWWEDHGLKTEQTEVMVWHKGDMWEGASYAGTFDLLADWNGDHWLLDHKTGSGIYPEMALQVAAYANADMWVVDGEDTIPTPITHLGLLHIRPDGTTLHEVPKDAWENATAKFDLLRQLWLINDHDPVMV